MSLLIVLIILFVIYYLFIKDISWRQPELGVEGFNESTGKLCNSCSNKTYNQCLNCFNCGFCVDKYTGKGRCVAGDHNGPYNYDDCHNWYSGDSFLAMNKMNNNYKCSYGPHQMN